MDGQYYNNEQLFQQRLNERMMNSQQQSTQEPQMNFENVNINTLPQPTVNTVLSNPHPSQVVQFVNADYNTKLSMAQSNPQLYAQIYNYLVNQQQQKAAAHAQQPSYPEVSNFPGHTYSNQTEPAIAFQPQVSYPDNDAGDESSELSNYHSSDDELNDAAILKTTVSSVPQPQQSAPIVPTTTPPKRHTIPMNAAPKKKLASANTRNNNKRVAVVSKAPTQLFLPLDFRRDLYEITNQNEYVLSFPKKHNVSKLSLNNCVISCNDTLLNEPYIYVKISEIPGSYEITGDTDTTVFGKLVQEKTMNGFIFYTPENCEYVFREPQRLNKLTFSFLNYNLEPISLTDLDVKSVKKSTNFLKLVTNGEHCLRTGSDVSVCYESTDRRTIERLDVVELTSPNSLILNKPNEMHLVGNCLSFSVMNVKCALTIQLAI